MNFFQVLKEAVSSINANRTRSLLTILGIIIGVGAVIALLALGSGVQETISSQIEAIGTNVIYVMPGNSMKDLSNIKQLTLKDVDALSNRAHAPHVIGVTPVNNSFARVEWADKSVETSIIGSRENYDEILDLQVAEGSFYTAKQVESRASVVVIGPDLAEKLTGRRSGVVGTVIRINNYPFRVIGITKDKGNSQYNNPDMFAFIPITSMQQRVQRQSSADRVNYLIVQAQDSDSMTAAMSETTSILRRSHRLSPRQENDFTITNQTEILSIANSITSVLTYFLAGIAAISLLVGGIGIMNIMLVSVTERTREIGLRKALGARRNDIRLQFLTESGLLSLIGGLIGVLVGWSLSALVGWIAQRAGVPLTPTITWQSVLLATAFAGAVGVFFGWYPANRASLLEPVEALRYE